MLRLQYYNSVVKNNHINKILNNYKLKYSRIVNEIESKVNEMMKLYLKDILAFLENIEEVAQQKQKISEFDKNKRELEFVKQKLKDKTQNDNKLKTDFELLQQENTLLKLKINSLNQKILFLKNNNLNNSLNSSISQEKNISNKFNRSMPKMNNSTIIPNVSKSSSSIVLNTTSILEEENSIKSTLNLNKTTKNNLKCEKNLKIIDKSKLSNKNNNQNKKSFNANKFIKNKVVKSTKSSNKDIHLKFNNILSNNFGKSSDKNNDIIPPKSSRNLNVNKINKKKVKNTKIRKNKSTELQLNNINIYSPLNTFNNTYNQSFDLEGININLNFIDIEKNVNEALDTELKELEQDEANIELLLEQLSDEDEHEDEI